jgi:hypothetical protein
MPRQHDLDARVDSAREEAEKSRKNLENAVTASLRRSGITAEKLSQRFNVSAETAELLAEKLSAVK